MYWDECSKLQNPLCHHAPTLKLEVLNIYSLLLQLSHVFAHEGLFRFFPTAMSSLQEVSCCLQPDLADDCNDSADDHDENIISNAKRQLFLAFQQKEGLWCLILMPSHGNLSRNKTLSPQELNMQVKCAGVANLCPVSWIVSTTATSPQTAGVAPRTTRLNGFKNTLVSWTHTRQVAKQTWEIVLSAQQEQQKKHVVNLLVVDSGKVLFHTCSYLCASPRMISSLLFFSVQMQGFILKLMLQGIQFVRPPTAFELISDRWNDEFFNPVAQLSGCHKNFAIPTNCSQHDREVTALM